MTNRWEAVQELAKELFGDQCTHSFEDDGHGEIVLSNVVISMSQLNDIAEGLALDPINITLMRRDQGFVIDLSWPES